MGMLYFADMYFKVSLRQEPTTHSFKGYCRLVESYRNAENRVCHRAILNVGFPDHLKPEQLNKIQKELTHRAEEFLNYSITIKMKSLPSMSMISGIK